MALLRNLVNIDWVRSQTRFTSTDTIERQIKASKRRYPLLNILQHLCMLEPIEKHEGLITCRLRQALTWHASTMTPLNACKFLSNRGMWKNLCGSHCWMESDFFYPKRMSCKHARNIRSGITFHTLSLAVHCWVSSSSPYDCLRHDINQRITFAWRTRKVYTR